MWRWFFGGLVVLAAAGGGAAVVVARGKRLTMAAAASGEVLSIAPAALARQIPGDAYSVRAREDGDPAVAAARELDEYSLARVLASEAAGRKEAERIAIGHVVMNEARARKLSVTALVTSGKVGAGNYGAQNAGGRFVSTARDPYTADLDLARKLIRGQIPDPTGGARKFFHPAAQDKQVAAGVKGVTKSAAEVIAAWKGDGYQPVIVAGVPADEFLAFRRIA